MCVSWGDADSSQLYIRQVEIIDDVRPEMREQAEEEYNPRAEGKNDPTTKSNNNLRECEGKLKSKCSRDCWWPTPISLSSFSLE